MTRRMFKDEEILDPTFPDPRMKESDHRPLRHEWYRKREREKRGAKVLERAEQIINQLFATDKPKRTKNP